MKVHAALLLFVSVSFSLFLLTFPLLTDAIVCKPGIAFSTQQMGKPSGNITLHISCDTDLLTGMMRNEMDIRTNNITFAFPPYNNVGVPQIYSNASMSMFTHVVPGVAVVTFTRGSELYAVHGTSPSIYLYSSVKFFVFITSNLTRDTNLTIHLPAEPYNIYNDFKYNITSASRWTINTRFFEWQKTGIPPKNQTDRWNDLLVVSSAENRIPYTGPTVDWGPETRPSPPTTSIPTATPTAIVVTDAPTEPATEAPTIPPTPTPTSSPPTQSHNEGDPTPTPSLPTVAEPEPTTEVTSSPTTVAPTEVPTQVPTEAPTSAPTTTTTIPPTEEPNPTNAPTTATATEEPTETTTTTTTPTTPMPTTTAPTTPVPTTVAPTEPATSAPTTAAPITTEAPTTPTPTTDAPTTATPTPTPTTAPTTPVPATEAPTTISPTVPVTVTVTDAPTTVAPTPTPTPTPTTAVPSEGPTTGSTTQVPTTPVPTETPTTTTTTPTTIQPPATEAPTTPPPVTEAPTTTPTPTTSPPVTTTTSPPTESPEPDFCDGCVRAEIVLRSEFSTLPPSFNADFVSELADFGKAPSQRFTFSRKYPGSTVTHVDIAPLDGTTTTSRDVFAALYYPLIRLDDPVYNHTSGYLRFTTLITAVCRNGTRSPLCGLPEGSSVNGPNTGDKQNSVLLTSSSTDKLPLALGLGLGIGLCCLFLLLALCFTSRRRQEQKQQQQHQDNNKLSSITVHDKDSVADHPVPLAALSTNRDTFTRENSRSKNSTVHPAEIILPDINNNHNENDTAFRPAILMPVTGPVNPVTVHLDQANSLTRSSSAESRSVSPSQSVSAANTPAPSRPSTPPTLHKRLARQSQEGEGDRSSI